MVARTSVHKKHYLDIMGSASSLVLPLPTCAELVRCANRASCPLTILGYENYYPGGSKGCVTHLNAKVTTYLIPANPPSVSLPISTLKCFDAHIGPFQTSMTPGNWLLDIAWSVILLPPYCSADLHITSVMKAFLTSEEVRSIPYKSGQSLMVRMCT